MEKLKPCPFCGEKMFTFIEDECGQHTNMKWYMLNHSCFVEIELLQEGGTEEEFIKEINHRT